MKDIDFYYVWTSNAELFMFFKLDKWYGYYDYSVPDYASSSEISSLIITGLKMSGYTVKLHELKYIDEVSKIVGKNAVYSYTDSNYIIWEDNGQSILTRIGNKANRAEIVPKLPTIHEAGYYKVYIVLPIANFDKEWIYGYITDGRQVGWVKILYNISNGSCKLPDKEEND